MAGLKLFSGLPDIPDELASATLRDPAMQNFDQLGLLFQSQLVGGFQDVAEMHVVPHP